MTPVGFREANSNHLTNIGRCPVLPEHPALNWDDWRSLINTLSGRSHITQIEPLWADNALAFVLRVLRPLGAADVDGVRFTEADKIIALLFTEAYAQTGFAAIVPGLSLYTQRMIVRCSFGCGKKKAAMPVACGRKTRRRSGMKSRVCG